MVCVYPVNAGGGNRGYVCMVFLVKFVEPGWVKGTFVSFFRLLSIFTPCPVLLSIAPTVLVVCDIIPVPSHNREGCVGRCQLHFQKMPCVVPGRFVVEGRVPSWQVGRPEIKVSLRTSEVETCKAAFFHLHPISITDRCETGQEVLVYQQAHPSALSIEVAPECSAVWWCRVS